MDPAQPSSIPPPDSVVTENIPVQKPKFPIKSLIFAIAPALVVIVLFIVYLFMSGSTFMTLGSNSSTTNKKANSTNDSSSKVAANTLVPTTVVSSPKEIVTSFLEAVQKKDKQTAQSYLSSDVNKQAFQSTFANNDSGQSLYSTDFKFEVIDQSIASDSGKAWVAANTQISSLPYPLIINYTLTKDTAQNWKIQDEIGSGIEPASLSGMFRAVPTSTVAERVVLRIQGPAVFALTNPSFIMSEYNPGYSAPISNLIPGVGYTSNAGTGIISIQDMYGSWRLLVVGTKDGQYQISTELIDPNNHQTQTITGDIKSGDTAVYLLNYPTAIGKPLEVTKASQ